mgnify:CR=1 FL=1
MGLEQSGKRRKLEHEPYFWFEKVDLGKQGGDLGLYDHHHREIARTIIKFEQIRDVRDRMALVPTLRTHLTGLLSILDAYDIDPTSDLTRTLEQVNEWLPGHEITIRMASGSRRRERSGRRGRNVGAGNPRR